MCYAAKLVHHRRRTKCFVKFLLLFFCLAQSFCVFVKVVGMLSNQHIIGWHGQLIQILYILLLCSRQLIRNNEMMPRYSYFTYVIPAVFYTDKLQNLRYSYKYVAVRKGHFSFLPTLCTYTH